MPEEVPQPAAAASLSPWEPLKQPMYRMLWPVWLTANMCMWMNDVASAWMMTSMTSTPLWVALVQSASTLPVFLLGLPSGALADIVDRRRYFIVTQFWVAAVAVVLSIAVMSGVVTPPLLLALTFANGIGLAMRWPVFAAIVPELVPRAQLPAALALNGIAMNASRIAGPLIAGALIASAGTAYVFALNAVLSTVSAFVIMRWKREHVPDPLGRERLLGAMRVGLQFLAQSTRLRAVLVRIGLFFLHATALLALLPLVARSLHGGDAATFTMLLAAMGAGAIMAAMYLPRLRQKLTRDTLVIRSIMLQSVSMAAMAVAPNIWIAIPAMMVNGASWITCGNSLSVSAQLSLPDWVRARGMAMFQMAVMGSSAIGAALWGQIATVTSVSTCLLIAAVSGTVTMLIARRWVGGNLNVEEDLTPSREVKTPVVRETPGKGQVMVMIEYLIDPDRSDDFRNGMREVRRSRLRQGALEWELLHDMNQPGRFIEQIVDESWTEHLRRFDRFTASDVALRELRLAFHIGDEPPKVTRYLLEDLTRT